MTAAVEFDRCLRRPVFYRNGSFAVHLCGSDNAGADSAAWRLGLVIPKRHEASAVARNTIKRRWRDAFRRGRMAWATEFGGADVVVRLQSPLIPKPAPAAKIPRAKAPLVVATPATVRAHERFDPTVLLGALVDRLRRRGGLSTIAAARPPKRSTPVSTSTAVTVDRG